MGKPNKTIERNKKKEHSEKTDCLPSTENRIATLQSICETISVLKAYCKRGLGALGNNERKKIVVPSTSQLNSSVNLDEAAKAAHPHENRWDYAIEYSGQTYFIEIHPAHTSEIDCMVKKVQFVKSWLQSTAPSILTLPGPGKFYWVSSGTTALRITPNSSQARKLALNKILPVGQTWDYMKVCK